MLESIKTHLESLSPQQRYDVDSKAESLHKHWIELKDLVLKRVDCVSVLIEFFEKANEFASQIDNLKRQLAQTPSEQKLQFLQETWSNMRSDFSDLKNLGSRFLNWKVCIVEVKMLKLKKIKLEFSIFVFFYTCFLTIGMA